jgi:hypothetical protein
VLELTAGISLGLITLCHTFIDELPLPLGIATHRRLKGLTEENKEKLNRRRVDRLFAVDSVPVTGQ